MSRGLQKKIRPGPAAAIVLVVIVIIQWAWWKGLVFVQLQPPPPFKPAPPGQPPGPKVLQGHTGVIVETLTGDLAPGRADGPGHFARFDRPTGLAIDSQGSLYVADTGNNAIRRVAPGGDTTTVTGGESGFADGAVFQARFNAPCGVAVAPDGALYVADTGNRAIRCIRNGQVTTLIGGPTAPATQLKLPTGVAYVSGPAPYLVVADPGGRRVVKFGLDGVKQSEQVMAGPVTFTLAPPRAAAAIPQTGTLVLAAATMRDMHVEDPEKPGDFTRLPQLKQPTAIWPYGSGWLVVDGGNGAVFAVQNGVADVLAGICVVNVPLYGSKDGDGADATFGSMSAVVTDGVKYIYTSDTSNNTIRRITVPRGS